MSVVISLLTIGAGVALVSLVASVLAAIAVARTRPTPERKAPRHRDLTVCVVLCASSMMTAAWYVVIYYHPGRWSDAFGVLTAGTSAAVLAVTLVIPPMLPRWTTSLPSLRIARLLTGSAVSGLAAMAIASTAVAGMSNA